METINTAQDVHLQHISGDDKRPVAAEWENGPAKRQRLASGDSDPEDAESEDQDSSVVALKPKILKLHERPAILIMKSSGCQGPVTSSGEEAAAGTHISRAPSVQPIELTIISDDSEESQSGGSTDNDDDDELSTEPAAPAWPQHEAAAASAAVTEANTESVLWYPDPTQTAPPRWHTHVRCYQRADNIRSIKMANPKRSYRLWQDEQGLLNSTFGALIPDGYSLWSSDDPAYPWVCPVRDCRRLCFNLPALGSHFIRHRKSLLNDNRDGTFTVVGTYSEQLLGEGGLPAVVITQQPGNTAPIISSSPYSPRTNPSPAKTPLPSRASQPPAITPTYSVPVLRPHAKTSTLVKAVKSPRTDVPHTQSFARTSNAELDANGDFVTPIPGNPANMWTYVKKFLRNTPLPPTNGHVPDVIGLPRKRDIRWNATWKNGFFESFPRDVTALIMHITGDYPPDACTRCKANKGPFGGCIVMSKQVKNNTIISCSNCWYHGYQVQCTLKDYLRAMQYPATGTNLPDADTTAATAPEASLTPPSTCIQPPKSIQFPVRLPLSLPEQTTNLGCRTSRPTRSEQVPGRTFAPAVQETRKIYTRSLSSGVKTSQSSAVTSRHSSPAASTALDPRNPQIQTVAEALEMEDWEVGPGWIKSQRDDGESIAFSNAYLLGGTTGSSSVPVADGISFCVQVVRPGTNHIFKRDSTKTRICSLASGKLQVKIQDEAELTLGPHGMFKIRPGVSCTVRNRIYLDCILHVSSIVTEDVQDTE